jgi:type II secretory ATPase GspE/PulE/Tfp pilus assembly ATPase PilB-like protein
MRKTKKKLGEMLLEIKAIKENQLELALSHQRRWGGKIGSILIDMGIVDEETVATTLEKQLGCQCVSLKGSDVSEEAIKAVKYELAKRFHIMPLKLTGKTLTIATSDMGNIKMIDELSFSLGFNIKTIFAVESSIARAIKRSYLKTFTKPDEYTGEDGGQQPEDRERESEKLVESVIGETTGSMELAEEVGSSPKNREDAPDREAESPMSEKSANIEQGENTDLRSGNEESAEDTITESLEVSSYKRIIDALFDALQEKDIKEELRQRILKKLKD